MKRAPLPSSLSTLSEPPSDSAICREIHSPSPEPPVVRARHRALEALEDALRDPRRDADALVADADADARAGAVVRRPRAHGDRLAAPVLDGVRQQVGHHLIDARGIEAPRSAGGASSVIAEPLALAVARTAIDDVGDQRRQIHVADVEVERPLCSRDTSSSASISSHQPLHLPLGRVEARAQLLRENCSSGARATERSSDCTCSRSAVSGVLSSCDATDEELVARVDRLAQLRRRRSPGACAPRTSRVTSTANVSTPVTTPSSRSGWHTKSK